MNALRIESGDVPRCIAGVDGCHAGWIIAIARTGQDTIRLEVRDTLANVLACVGERAIVVVDIPIGLLDKRQRGGRLCDVEARKRLGKRRSSVFNPPSRDALHVSNFDEARRFGLGRQGFGILPKIRQVDELMIPAMQGKVVESHPELAFVMLVGRPMSCKKYTTDGHEERLEALKATAALATCRPFADAVTLIKAGRSRFKQRDVATDDIVDAYVMLYVAARIAAGVAERVPANPPIDRRGLRMEMWY